MGHHGYDHTVVDEMCPHYREFDLCPWQSELNTT